MKPGLATAVLTLLVLAVLALCFLALAPRPAGIAYLKDLLFADDPLAKSAELFPGGNPLAETLFHGFAAAQSHVRAGKVEEAKTDLWPLLKNPETRIQLWAWRALRELGEKPDPKTGDPVQGVVCELSTEGGGGTLAVYADGRARWLGEEGAVKVWEAPGKDAEIDQGIRKLLGAGEPLVRSAPARDQHLATALAKDHFRVSVLTFGGVHVVEAFGPDIDEAHALAPALLASTSVIQALARQASDAGKSGGR